MRYPIEVLRLQAPTESERGRGRGASRAGPRFERKDKKSEGFQHGRCQGRIRVLPTAAWTFWRRCCALGCFVRGLPAGSREEDRTRLDRALGAFVAGAGSSFVSFCFLFVFCRLLGCTSMGYCRRNSKDSRLPFLFRATTLKWPAAARAPWSRSWRLRPLPQVRGKSGDGWLFQESRERPLSEIWVPCFCCVEVWTRPLCP